MKLAQLVFNDARLRDRYANKKIPMSTFYEAYFDGAIDVLGDMDSFLRTRNDVVKFTITKSHLKWAVTNFVPEVTIHSKAQDTRIIRENYDRGNDFYGWFLGERMVYTSGFFQSPDDTLEQAQDNKMNLICQKLQLKPGERLLDIGCGWGTLARHAAREHGVDATGVTLSRNQTEYGNERMVKEGLADRARIICCDYRDTPKKTYDKIVSVEMVEHVGVKNLKAFYEQVYSLLADDGLFLLQWTGIRRGYRPEDLIWGLFMNKYVFPGADASLCPSRMIAFMEKAGWEMHSAENITNHYGHTLHRWHQNWMSNREAIVAKYGERWYRIWNLFLPWSVLIAEQGTGACLQVVLNKDIYAFDRKRFIGEPATLGERTPLARPKIHVA